MPFPDDSEAWTGTVKTTAQPMTAMQQALRTQSWQNNFFNKKTRFQLVVQSHFIYLIS